MRSKEVLQRSSVIVTTRIYHYILHVRYFIFWLPQNNPIALDLGSSRSTVSNQLYFIEFSQRFYIKVIYMPTYCTITPITHLAVTLSLSEMKPMTEPRPNAMS